MAGTAAHLVDNVFPAVPIRQWVLSLPFSLRYRLAYDSALMSKVLNIFIRTVFAEMRSRAKRLLGLHSVQCGAVTFIQRFNDALQISPHFHSVVMDGIFAANANGKPEFHELPPLEDSDVLRVATRIAEKVEALLKRRGLSPEDDPDDALSHDQPGLAAMYSASVCSRVAAGPNLGNRVVRLGDYIDGDGFAGLPVPLCAMVRGFNVHANTRIDGRDRRRLERLIRYVARPAISSERLSELPDGRLAYQLKRRWRNGATQVVFDRPDFLAKLAALVPAPRTHLTTFHGVVGPAAKWRPLIVPAPVAAVLTCPHVPAFKESADPNSEKETIEERSPAPPRRKNYTWSQLLRRVFDIDVSICELCGGPVKIIAAIEDPTTVQKILDHLALPSKPPPISPARNERPRIEHDFAS